MIHSWVEEAFQCWSSETKARQIFAKQEDEKTPNDVFKLSCSYVLEMNIFIFCVKCIALGSTEQERGVEVFNFAGSKANSILK